MGSRQQKLGRQLQKDLGTIIDGFIRNTYPGVLVSVMEVRVTPDLGLAKTYLSIFNAASEEAVMNHLTEAIPEIRHQLAVLLRNQVRKIPELVFFPDNTQETAQRIDQLLNNLDLDEPKAQDE